MPRHWLTIEHCTQEAEAGCLAACVQMALAHLGILLSQQTLNRLFGLTAAGVPTSRLERLKRYGVQATLRQGTVDDLRREIDRGLPPILFLRTGLLPGWSIDTQHAVLVSGYDGEDFLVNDPAFLTAPQRIDVATLELAWDEFDCRYAIIER